VKVLVFGNSNDTDGWVPEGSRRSQDIIRDRLAAEFGEPVEVVAKNTWPNDRMPSYVAKCIDEAQPDLVFFNVTTYPFAYESLPLRVRRIFGRFGEPLGDAGMRLAESKRWSHNAVFRTLRRWGQATIGGDTHFTPQEVIERYAEAIRVAARSEGTVVAVKGPFARGKKGTQRERNRQEVRRKPVHMALKQLCAQLHVHYAGSDEPYWRLRPTPKGAKAGDGLHSNEKGHAHLAEDHYAVVRDAWAAHIAFDTTTGQKLPANV
jgi:hypothetical protein